MALSAIQGAAIFQEALGARLAPAAYGPWMSRCGIGYGYPLANFAYRRKKLPPWPFTIRLCGSPRRPVAVVMQTMSDSLRRMPDSGFAWLGSLAALAPLLAALPVWFFIRPSPAASAGPEAARVIAGWLLLLLVVTTWSAITLAATSSILRRVVFAELLLAAALTLTLGITVPTSSAIDLMVSLRCLAVLAAWSLLCLGLAAFLRRFTGAAAATVLTAGLAAGLLSLPVSAAPLFNALAAQKSGPGTMVLVNACPALWLVDALRPDIHFDWVIWFHEHLLYRLTPLGQNILMPPLAPWWVMCLVASAIGIALIGAVKK